MRGNLRPGFCCVRFIALSWAMLLGGCALNGDFARVRPELVTDDIHSWVGRDAAAGIGGPVSEYPLTDDERLLRDLAYPLIEPPYNRNRWDSVWREYGLGQPRPREMPPFDRTAYWFKLNDTHRRSEASAYARLVTDARNDVERLDPFFSVGTRVLDMDHKRARSVAYVSGLSAAEHANALNRNTENSAIVAWVCRSLQDRTAAYRYALERLVIAVPSPAAAEADRSINLLHARVQQLCAIGTGRRVVVAKD